MFVRVKTSRNSPRKSVQIVESVREGKKVRQRIVRHVGVAMDAEEEGTLRQLAEHIKSRMLHKRRPGLLPPEQVAETAIEAGRRRGTGGPLPVEDLSRLREEHRVIARQSG
ncbi:MAG: hypothetical protein F4186_10570 [Boseongicola sp. SB0676_bin_33]|nr:hypothetical protein [Boseongicola sp. SB0676_bin_33]MYK32705.1 hypothetical protein [Boseongicola sp. SB0670_bin_30]